MRSRPSFLLLLTALSFPQASAASNIPRILKKSKPEKSTQLDDYLKRVRVTNLPAPETAGSLWVSNSPLAIISSDYKAHNPGDLVVIRLVDNFTAATNGENKQSRQFSNTAGVTGLLGKLSTTNRLQTLFNATSNTGLDGKGASTMSSNVTMRLAGEVIETLPNGTLVVQAARDITVGNDRQTVLLRGLVRPGDLAPDNSVISSAIS